MTRLWEVLIGDEVVATCGAVSAPVTVEAVDLHTITAGGRQYDRASGNAVLAPEQLGRSWRLRTRDEYHRETGAVELGRYLAALQRLVDSGVDVDALVSRMTDSELIAARHAGQKLCDLLGVRP